MCRIEQVSLKDLGKRQKVAARSGANRVKTWKFKDSKFVEYIIPLFKRGEKLWRLSR